MARPLILLLGTFSAFGIGALAAAPAHAENQREGALRRCGGSPYGTERQNAFCARETVILVELLHRKG